MGIGIEINTLGLIKPSYLLNNFIAFVVIIVEVDVGRKV